VMAARGAPFGSSCTRRMSGRSGEPS
jgi:hypothetical protein